MGNAWAHEFTPGSRMDWDLEILARMGDAWETHVKCMAHMMQE